jgi:hypothetical protein
MVVGISGQLVALEVFLNGWADEGKSEAHAAYHAAGPRDFSTLLASRTITPFGMPPGLSRRAVHFDLSSAQLQVIAGRLLAMIEGNPAAGRVDLPGPVQQVAGPPAGPVAAAGGGAGLGVSVSAQPDPTPEPTTIALVGSGLLLGAMGRRRQRQRKQPLEG